MFIHGPTESVLLKVADPLAVRALLRQSKAVIHPDYNVAVRHTLESAKVLRNLGHDVPAPIGSQYRWPGKYKPFAHQKVMAEFLTLNRRAFNLSEMGSMKTAATLWAADWLMSKGFIRKALVVCPLQSMERTWQVDIFDTLMHRRVVQLRGSREKRLEALKLDVDFYIINHDGITIDPIFEELRRRPDIDLIIVDEVSKFRNGGTIKFKKLKKLVDPVERWLWVLSGTPCPNSPTDAWALAHLVNPARVPKNFGTFKREVMLQVSQFKWVPKAEGYNQAYSAMQPAVRFLKKDCIDLPPVVTVERECELTKEQKTAFNAMRLLMQAEAKTKTITAANAADQIGKLRQILLGAVKDPISGDYITLPHGPRLQVLLDTIEEASAKVIVIVPFKGAIRALEHEITKAGYTVGVLNGDVSSRRRDQIIRDFKETADPHILLCHPAVMSHGLNLTEADTLIFYGPIYSNDDYQQVLERFNRAGQVNKMTVVKMGAHALEWDIYKVLDNKGITQDNILKLYQSVTE